MDFRDYPQVAEDFMNHEHAEFVELLNQAEDDLLMGGDVLKRLQQLYQHCVEHFGHEEAEMLAHNFPPYPMHKQEHERVLALFRQQIEAYQRSGDDAIMLEFLQEGVPQWFIQHLNSMDRVTAQFLFQQKGHAA